MRSPYSHLEAKSLDLRDLLAVDRTIAANERTFLGYLRTTLALVATGGSLLHFVDEPWAIVLGLSLLVCSAPLMLVGTRSYIKRRRALAPFLRTMASRP